MIFRIFRRNTGTRKANSNNQGTGHPWWLLGVLSSLTGVFLSVIISSLISLGTYLHVPVIGNVERLGADMSALVRAKMLPDDPVRSNPPGGVALPRYVFLDVDEKACENFASQRESANRLCRLNNPVSAEVTAAAIRAARSAQAAVLIIDVAPFENQKQRDTVTKALSERLAKTEIETWIIAPPAGRHKLDTGALWGDIESDLRSSKDGAPLKLAIMGMSTDPDSDDEKVRRVSRSAEVFEAAGQGRRVLPSAPYLAALRLKAIQDFGPGRLRDNQEALRRIDCEAYGAGCQPDVPVASAKGSDPIAFSMFSLSQEAAEQMRSDSQSLQSLSDSELIALNRRYERVVASRVPSVGLAPSFDLSAPQYKGAVIVLGSSLVSAGDLHATPIGLAAGPEIVLNAVRTYMENPLAAEHGRGGAFWAKLQGLFIGFAVMTLTWVAVYWLLSRESHPTVVRMVLRRLTVAFVFVTGMGLALALELFFLSYSLSRAKVTGDIDILTPVVMLGLEGYASATKFLAKGIEHALGLAVATLLAIWFRFRSNFISDKASEDP